ncbi:hypothetical protein Pmani_039526 [Petrolisthes manimaculis]|uniref:Uncharacterized protein n=1 Tax=Petrolisthes manimaculis TaxID=1843537 RepID=A0AAE1TJE7_9EUCA|nr:hypothetical protein Pmani_039526 [Petrolisthes manimaculis]
MASSLSVEQFQRRVRNWNWHSSMAQMAPLFSRVHEGWVVLTEAHLLPHQRRVGSSHISGNCRVLSPPPSPSETGPCRRRKRRGSY